MITRQTQVGLALDILKNAEDSAAILDAIDVLERPADIIANLDQWGLAMVTKGDLVKLETALAAVPPGVFSGGGPVTLQATRALGGLANSTETFAKALEARGRLDIYIEDRKMWEDQKERWSVDPADAAISILEDIRKNWEPAIKQLALQESLVPQSPLTSLMKEAEPLTGKALLQAGEAVVPLASILDADLDAVGVAVEKVRKELAAGGKIEVVAPAAVPSGALGLENMEFVRFQPADDPSNIPFSFLCNPVGRPEETSIYMKIPKPGDMSKADLLVMKEEFDARLEQPYAPKAPGQRAVAKILAQMRLDARAPGAIDTVDQHPSEIVGKVRLDLVKGWTALRREASLVQILVNQFGKSPINKSDGVREEAQEFFLRILTDLEGERAKLAILGGDTSPQALANVLDNLDENELAEALKGTRDRLISGMVQMAQKTPHLMEEIRRLEEFLAEYTEGPTAGPDRPQGEKAVDCAIRYLDLYNSQRGLAGGAGGLQLIGVGAGTETPGDYPTGLFLQWDDSGNPCLYVKSKDQPPTVRAEKLNLETGRAQIKAIQEKAQQPGSTIPALPSTAESKE